MANIILVNKDGNRVVLNNNSFCNGPQPESVLAVHFSCGDCCKKVIGFNVELLVLDFIENEVLFVAENFEIKTFSGGKLVNEQMSTTQVRIIPITRLCLTETDPIELNPNNPIDIGVSPFAVEVDCGGCCKKILNINDVVDSQELTLLFPPDGELLYILTFNDGNLVNLQSATNISVLSSRICSIEENVTEVPLPQPQPVTRGVSFSNVKK